MMRRTASVPLLTAVLVVGGCMGGVEWADEDLFDHLPGLDDGGRADGFGEGETSAEKQVILDRMRARRGEVRALKEDLVIGETHDGFLAIVDDAAAPLADQGYAAHARAVVDAENADRRAFYELCVAGYEGELREQLRQQIEEQMPELRRQVIEQLCADEGPFFGRCAEITEGVIQAALQEAINVSIEAAVEGAMIEIRTEVYAMYADFWQDRGTLEGEWVEVLVAPDEHAWAPKASSSR